VTEKDLGILAEVLRIATRNATSTDRGYIDRAEAIILQESQSLKTPRSTEARLAEDLNGHVFLALPEDGWMVSRYIEEV
jgi:hypothetical protein